MGGWGCGVKTGVEKRPDGKLKDRLKRRRKGRREKEKEEALRSLGLTENMRLRLWG